MNHSESWQAKWEGSMLHIDGITDLFPNEFSTAHLRLRTSKSEPDRDIVAYEIGFGRDKEPFCTKDLIGPVHHWEQDAPKTAKLIRIYADADDYIEIAVPNSE